MGIDDTQESRLLARGVRSDDPAWGEVSAFLGSVDAAYADVTTAHVEAAHLAAVSHEARLFRGELQPGRRKTMKDWFALKTHRVLIGSLSAAVVALTAGVGVASAMGGGPLAGLLPAADPTLTPGFTIPSPAGTESEAAEDADDQGEDENIPTATPTAGHEAEDADDQGEDADDQGEDADGDHPSRGDNDDDESDDDSDEADDDSDEPDDDSEEADDDGDDEDHEAGSTDDDGDDDGGDSADDND